MYLSKYPTYHIYIYVCVYPYIIYHDDQSTMLPYTIYQYIISRIPYIYPLYHIRYSISRFMVWMHLCIHISYLPSAVFSRMTHQQCCHISYPIYLLYPLYTNTVTLTILAAMLTIFAIFVYCAVIKFDNWKSTICSRISQLETSF